MLYRFALLVFAALFALVGCISQPEKTTLEQANDHFDASDWDNTIRLCDQAINSGTEIGPAYLLKGRALLSKGQIQESIDCYTKTIELVPNDDEAYHFRAAAYKQVARQTKDASKRYELESWARRDKQKARELDNYGLVDIRVAPPTMASIEAEIGLRNALAESEHLLSSDLKADVPTNDLPEGDDLPEGKKDLAAENEHDTGDFDEFKSDTSFEPTTTTQTPTSGPLDLMDKWIANLKNPTAETSDLPPEPAPGASIDREMLLNDPIRPSSDPIRLQSDPTDALDPTGIGPNFPPIVPQDRFSIPTVGLSPSGNPNPQRIRSTGLSAANSGGTAVPVERNSHLGVGNVSQPGYVLGQFNSRATAGKANPGRANSILGRSNSQLYGGTTSAFPGAPLAPNNANIRGTARIRIPFSPPNSPTTGRQTRPSRP